MNVEMARQGLREYWSSSVQEGSFSPAKLKSSMEPVFKAAGYRDLPGADVQPRILIIRDDAAGDFVLFSAFLREARRIYRGAHITLLVSSRNYDLAGCCPYVDNVIKNNVLDELHGNNDIKANIGGVVELSLQLMEYGFNLAFSPRLGIRSFGVLAAYMCGAAQVVAFTQDRINKTNNQMMHLGWDCLITVAVPVLQKVESDVDRNLFILEWMTRMPIVDRELEVWFTERERRNVLAMLEPLKKEGLNYFIAAVPAASLKMKQWPVERYISVIKEIIEQNKNAGVVVMGGPDDVDVSLRLKSALGDRAISTAGSLSYRESAALMNMMNVYIGNDTGLMHIAAACHVPILVINCFAASLGRDPMAIPYRFMPYRVPGVTVQPSESREGCDSRYAYGCEHNDEPHCILGVSTEAVLTGYSELLKRIAAKDIKQMFLRS